ncbi:MAG: DUF5706 domain-containing protein [Cytophagales bacterium]|nr:DUF5706 domain-containing protein [Cytophagales bacterium]
METTILNKAKEKATYILREELSEDITYHTLNHTEFVVSAARKIGAGEGLSENELELLELAAWFHDTGYSKSIDNHEEASTSIAREFLTNEAFPEGKIQIVEQCILATRMPQSPKQLIEEVLCDADLSHLGGDDFFDRSEALCNEINKLHGENMASGEWLQKNRDFLSDHAYFTAYAKEHYGEVKAANLKTVKKRLKSMKKSNEEEKLQQKIEELKVKVKQAKELTPTRGIETMFRLTSKNHLELSSIADNKANIMISINTLILSIMISVLFRKLEEYPHMVVPSIILTLVCLATIVIGIIATRPNISKGVFTRDNIRNKETNLLFFGNFHSMKLEDYEWAMKEMLKDADYLYSSLIRDIYFLGKVLGTKYRMLRLAYTVFMFGFVASVIAFIIAELFFKAPYPY